MNTVAIPASAPVGVFSAEGDLVHQAARGDTEAFAELFRRHGQMAWRLAQAIAPDRDAAITSVANGFARALRGHRRRQADASVFRPALLGGVYRHAIDDARARAAAHQVTAPTMPKAAAKGTKGARRSKAEQAAVTAAAFRTLPERWRAALWLTEVESIAPERAAPILGVSAAAATQLIARGQRGFVGRLTQANAKVPEHLAPAFRAMALDMPANLGDLVAGAWAAVATGPSARIAPINLWLTERAVRPLQVGVASLLALGLVGIGLVGEGASNVNVPIASPGTTIPGSNSGVRGGNGAGGANGIGAPGSPLNSSGLGLNLNTAATGTAAAGGTAAIVSTTSPASGTPSTPGGSTGTTGPGGTTTSPGGSSPGTTGQGGGTTTPPGGGGTTTPPKAAPTTLLAVPGVASVTKSGNSASVNLLPSKSTTGGTTGSPTVALTVGCSTGIGLTIGTIQVGCPSNTTSPAGTTGPTTPTTNPGLLGTLLGKL